MSNTKRFIAGAVCPKCAEMDRLVTYTDAGDTFKECVACGFLEKQLVQVETSELNTRVNHLPEDEQPDDEVAQIVNIIQPPK